MYARYAQTSDDAAALFQDFTDQDPTVVPTISIFFGVVIQMYWRDHAPPHIHAYYQGYEALFSIRTGEVIGGRLPAKVQRLVGDWVLLHNAVLMGNWERGRQMLPFERVPGADVE